MARRAVSIEDIARIAGVSHSTVSRALRDSTLISAPVRSHIQQLAQELGYTPNAIAQSLQQRRTNTIGFVVTSISDLFFADVMQGAEEVARAAGLSVLLGAAHNDPEQEIAVIETFHQRRVDALLVASSSISRTHADRLMRVQVPTVLINSRATAHSASLHYVDVDDNAGAEVAAAYLRDIGHTRIGYLGTASRVQPNADRLDGYQRVIDGMGVPARVAVAGGYAATHEDDVAAGRAMLPALLEQGVSAIFCFNDPIAIGAMLAAQERGLRVPDDLSIVGFDDTITGRYVTPALTTIRQPKAELGRTAMELAIALLHQRPVEDQLLLPELVVRHSTRPMPDHSE